VDCLPASVSECEDIGEQASSDVTGAIAARDDSARDDSARDGGVTVELHLQPLEMCLVIRWERMSHVPGDVLPLCEKPSRLHGMHEIGSENSLECGGVAEMREPLVLESGYATAIELTRARTRSRLRVRLRRGECGRDRSNECDPRGGK